MLEWAMDNVFTQWIDENIRCIGEDEPSKLEIIFTKESGIIEEIKHKSPIGKSDHVLIDCILQEEGRKERNEEYEREWFDFNKADVIQLRNHFEEAQGDNFHEVDSVDEKWFTFLNIYNEGVEKWVQGKG